MRLNNRLILNKTNISNKKLHSPIFTQKLQDQVTRECSLQIPSTQIAYALPVYSSSHAGCIIITKTPELHFFINNEDIVYDNPDELLATFSWQKIKIAAYNNDLTQNAFGNTEKEILIISSDLSSTIINTGSIASNAPYTHLAFSCDGNYLTCIVDNKAYIINIATQKITPVIIPAKIFSSILVSDSVLLIRTINGNTYAYNLVSEKLKHIPQSKIDYFTTCYHENNQLHLYGFIEKIKPNKEIVTENATENIDLLAIA